MCPASTSNAMPSGIRQSVTMTLRSEPSGFTESTWLPLASRTNRRPIVARPTDACSDCEDLSCVMFYPFIVSRACREKGVRHLLCEAPSGPFRQKVPDPFFAASARLHTQGRAIDRPKRSIELRFQPVSRQVRDGDHHETVFFAEPDQVRHAGHGPVVVDDLADHAGWVQAREAGEIDGRLGLSTTLQHATGAGAQREDVSRSGE